MSQAVSGSPQCNSLLKRVYGPLFTPKLWLETVHLLLDLGVGIAGFTLAVTFLSLSAGLVITLVGIPLLAATVLMGRLFASFERTRSQIFLGDTPPAPHAFNFNEPVWTMVRKALKDTPGWKGLLYGILALPLGIFNFTITIVMWTVSTAFSLCVFTYWFANREDLSRLHWNAHLGSWNLTSVEGLSGWAAFGTALGITLVGLLLLALTPRIITGLAKIDQLLIRALCSPSPKGLLNQRVTALEESRSASVNSAANELRRIERDLHDGAQQHLVSVAMQLGLAKERMNDEIDPQISELVTSAHKDAKQAIIDLRDLVRGIHPTVLTDRGLDAAVSALAARSPIPVEVTNEVHRNLPSQVEATAYFVIGETLTNIAKHSQASEASVHLSDESDRIVIEVTDNGIGGAHNVADGGLSGLRDRVRSIDGDMTISSPAQGPTRIIVTLPCA